jgi:phage gp16-like protein
VSAIRDRRKAELAKIHIAKSQLGMDDDTYRQMLWTVARVNSSKDLDEGGRRRVLEHMRAIGFKGKQPGGNSYPGRPHNIETNPQLKKIEAVLADARRPWSYADSLAKRMFHVDRIAFCNPDQLQRIIAALSYDQKRRAKRAAS